MINLNYNSIRNAFLSINLFNISVNIHKSDKEGVETRMYAEEIEPVKQKKFKDYKTTLFGDDVGIIDWFNESLNVYLFVEKHGTSRAWNSVVPVIQKRSSKKITQFGSGWFALEGSGGGLGNTRSLLYRLQKHREKGYEVSIVPKVIDNKLLQDFEYVDSGVTLQHLIENSVDLINYQKDPFIWIFKQYNQLI